MGERLVLLFTQEINNQERKVSVYQHWSAYTASAIETAHIIQDAINDFIDSPEYKTLTPYQRFTKFAYKLGTGQIIANAYFTKNSQLLFDNQLSENNNQSTAIEPVSPLLKDAIINRTNGLVDINEETQSALDWAQMFDQFDLTDVFEQDKPMDIVNDLNYYSYFDAGELFTSLNIETDTYHSLQLKETHPNNTSYFFETALGLTIEDINPDEPLKEIFQHNDIIIVNSTSEIYETPNYEEYPFYLTNTKELFLPIE